MKAKLVRFILKAIACLPLSVVRAMGRGVGSLCWKLRTREAKVTLINLQQVFPEKSEEDLLALARESMRHWGVSIFEIPLIWGRSREWLEEKIVSQSGNEHWEQYLASDNGLIILGPHHGNWEVVGLACSARAGEMTNMFAPTGQQAVDDLISEARSRFGGILVPTDKRGVMALIKSLRNGGVVGVLPDQVPPVSGGIFSPFFGTSALTMSLIHNLIKRSGARVLFIYAKRVPDGFELVHLEPPEGIYSEDQQTSVDALNEGVQQCVLGAVAQYQWEYKRFKARPEGATPIYTKENMK